MTPKFTTKVTLPAKDLNQIQITPDLKQGFDFPETLSFRVFFDQMSYCVTSQIRAATSHEDYLKLQGKVEFLDELRIFIEKIRKPE